MSESCFGQSVQKLSENQEKMLFYETDFEVCNINRKALISSQEKIISKFGPKKNASFVLGKMYKNCLKLRKRVIWWNLLRESNINRKSLISSHDKITTKFGQKKWVSLVLGKVYENCTKIRIKCYLSKLTSKSVISIGNPLFGSKIR